MRASVEGTAIPMLPGLRVPFTGFTWVTGDDSVRPKPSMITPPVSSSKRRMISTGKGAEPLTTKLIEVRSYLGMSGAFTMAVIMVGTRMAIVGLVFVMVLRNIFNSKRGRRIMVEPEQTDQFITAVKPRTWKNGTTPRNRSFPGRNWGIHAVICWMLATRLL